MRPHGWRRRQRRARVSQANKPQGSETMQIMDAISEILKREGVEPLFCFPTTPIIEAAVAAGIRPVICRQERVGVHMADGCSRGQHGTPHSVFALACGPG